MYNSFCGRRPPSLVPSHHTTRDPTFRMIGWWALAPWEDQAAPANATSYFSDTSSRAELHRNSVFCDQFSKKKRKEVKRANLFTNKLKWADVYSITGSSEARRLDYVWKALRRRGMSPIRSSSFCQKINTTDEKDGKNWGKIETGGGDEEKREREKRWVS